MSVYSRIVHPGSPTASYFNSVIPLAFFPFTVSFNILLSAFYSLLLLICLKCRIRRAERENKAQGAAFVV